MKTLACKDIDSTVTCDFKAMGTTEEEVLQNMMVHAKETHVDKIAGVTDEQMAETMKPHIKDEAEVAM